MTVADSLSAFDYLVVGAGLSGATVARRLFERGKRVAILEKSSTPGGLCKSTVDPSTGIEVHTFGSHILHSSDLKATGFLSRFCKLNHYRHRVFSNLRGDRGGVYPFPINLETINQFFRRGVLDPDTARRLVKSLASSSASLSSEAALVGGEDNFEESAIRQMSRPLYEAFIRGYSRKQWGVDPRKLPASLMSRIPVRFSYNSDYFDDPWQGVPIGGYKSLFSCLLEGLASFFSVDFSKVRWKIGADQVVVYTGPLDEYFNLRFGALPWRSVSLEFETLERVRDFQGCAVMNYPSESVPFTRIHEFKHLHPESQRVNGAWKTIIAREYSSSFGPVLAYPVEPEGALARRYREAAALEKNTHFCGRLGTYRYLNMDQAVSEALSLAERI